MSETKIMKWQLSVKTIRQKFEKCCNFRSAISIDIYLLPAIRVLVSVHPRQPACSSFSHNVKSICLATWKWKQKLPGLTPHIQSQFEAYPVLASSPDHWPGDEDNPVSKKQLYSDGPPILTLHVPLWVSASPPDGVMMMPDAVIWLFREELWTSTPGWVFGGTNVPEVVILPLGTWKGDCERLGG